MVVDKDDVETELPALTDLLEVASGDTVSADVENTNNQRLMNKLITAYNWIIDSGADLTEAQIYALLQTFTSGIKTNSIKSIAGGATDVVLSDGTFKYGGSSSNLELATHLYVLTQIAAAATVVGSLMTGADGVTGGTAGAVPAPIAADNVNFLRGDGTWTYPVRDGDRGDITVTASGATWTVDTLAITTGKLNDLAATTAKIDDLAVTTGKIAADAVTFAKMQNVTGPVLLGRETASSGDASALTVGNHLTLTSSTLTLKGARTVYSSYSDSASASRQRVTNTTTETSIINGFSTSILDPGAAAWPTIIANSWNNITTYRVKAIGIYLTTGTPTMRAKVKLGTAIMLDTGAIATIASGASGMIEIEGTFTVISATATVGNIAMRISDEATRLQYNLGTAGTGRVTIDNTTNQTFDFTFQWGTASGSNIVEFTNITIERLY